jgi:L-Ala-D/L-Glu epimerase
MRLASLRFASVPIPFRHVFRHASASRSEACNVVVVATDEEGRVGVGEGCPRAYVTGETVEGALDFLTQVRADLCNAIDGLPALHAWMARHTAQIDLNPSAFCAIELALLDLLGRRAGVPIEDLLGLPRPRAPVRVTAVLGIAPMPIFVLQLLRYMTRGMRDVKLKLSGDRRSDGRRIRLLSLLPGRSARIRLDANNLWPDPDVAIATLRSLPQSFFALEEPVSAGDVVAMQRVASALALPVILDESLTRLSVLDTLAPDGRWILNLRISKLGGIQRTVDVLHAARARGIPVIVGCQVGETSLLARAGLTVAAAAGDALIAFEGGYGTHLLAHDLALPSITFDRRGLIAPGPTFDPSAPGLGLQINRAALPPSLTG